MKGDATRLRLTFPARSEYLVLGRLVLSGLARAEPMDPDLLGDMKLALTEACSNAIRHAYRDGTGIVEIRYELDEGELSIEVLDDGPGFDVIASRRVRVDDLEEGGLGIAIIEAVSDRMELGRRGDGTGSRLFFAKRSS